MSYPIYPEDNKILPYSPRSEFGFMRPDETYPNIYPEYNKILPYSPRSEFGFMSQDKILDIESIKYMSIDDIAQLYREGYRIEENSKIVSAQGGVTISTGAILLIGLGILTYLYIKK